MATEFSTKICGGSPHLSEIRVVLLGNDEVDKSKVVKSILSCRDLMGENVGQCMLHEGEQAGRRISVVEAPGWNLMKQTPESIKKSMERSAVLCPSGPHALLLVIPVKRDEEPIAGDIKAAEKHMESLSEHFWKHTIILFACDDGVGDFNIQSYFQKTKKILEKCKGRNYILERHSKISELLKKIEDLVEENCGDVFIPQTYYALSAGKTQDVRRRRGSLPKNPPDMTKAKPDFVNDRGMILMAVIGGIFSAVAGANYGVSGACAGLLLGYILGVLLHF